MEQVRIVKEMREHDKRNGRSGQFIRPRFMVWENVPGAFSSGNPKGADFQAVLEEIVKIVCREIPSIPIPEKGWPSAGCISGVGDSGIPFSVAWRIHDAQFWGTTQYADGRMWIPGTPQRRKRIALVADFGGLTAPEILFERKGLSGNPEQGEEERQGAAGSAEDGTGSASGVVTKGNGEAFLSPERHTSLTDGGGQAGQGYPCVLDNRKTVFGISPYDSNAMKSDNPHSGIYEAETTRTLDLNGGDPCCNQGGMAVVQGVDGYNQAVTGDVSIPIQASRVDPEHTPCVVIEGNGYRESHFGDGYKESDIMYTLNTTEHHAVALENHPNDSRIKISEDGKVQTLSGRMGTGGNNTPMVMERGSYQLTTGAQGASGYDKLGTQEAANDMYIVQNWNGEQTAPTLTSRNASGAQRMPDKENFNAVISFTTEQEPKIAEDKANTLRGRDYKDPPSVTFGLDRASYNQGRNAKYNVSIEKEKIGACVAKGPGAVYNSVVRRLTPEECELLQGFPKGWTDIGDWVDSKGKKHSGDSDSPRYKALGNSIALPFWAWLMKRISAQYERRATLGSLFDGISGFPLTWTRVNGIGSARWSSEIEEFPIAVCKKHFGDEDNGIEGDIRQWI